MPKMCNGCEFLNIDEYEQDLIKEKCGDCPPHICKKYNKRITYFPYNEPYIHPCEECECNQFVPLLSERDNDFELEQEVIFNTEFDCPFCGEKIDVCDVSVANVQLIPCDNCNKLIAVDGGDY